MSGRALYITQVGTSANGNVQRQHQILATLATRYGSSMDILSLGASPVAFRKWLSDAGLSATVLDGPFAHAARLNTTVWYGLGVVLCNKLRAIERFRFPLRTPIPSSWIDRYELIVCFYPWIHRLLELQRAGSKVVVDLNDVMADRHERIGTRRWITMSRDDERAVLESSSRCIAISESDADEFAHLYDVRPPVASYAPPHYQDLLALPRNGRPMRIGYLGAPNYLNEQTLQLLADPVFLSCLSEQSIELVVAGGICETAPSETLKALERGGAKILGRVNSVTEFYSQISTLVNPAGPSSGVKVKSIESLLAGCKLITTRWGADASLNHVFRSQITYIDWPVDAATLGEITVQAVRTVLRTDREVSQSYIDHSAQALGALLFA